MWQYHIIMDHTRMHWANFRPTTLAHTPQYTIFWAMILVKQCKHITTAHLSSLSLHIWKTLETWKIWKTHLRHLSSFFPRPNFISSFHFHFLFIFYSCCSLFCFSPAGNSLPTLPSPSSPDRTRTCVISYSQPATGELSKHFSNGSKYKSWLYGTD